MADERKPAAAEKPPALIEAAKAWDRAVRDMTHARETRGSRALKRHRAVLRRAEEALLAAVDRLGDRAATCVDDMAVLWAARWRDYDRHQCGADFIAMPLMERLEFAARSLQSALHSQDRPW